MVRWLTSHPQVSMESQSQLACLYWHNRQNSEHVSIDHRLIH